MHLGSGTQLHPPEMNVCYETVRAGRNETKRDRLMVVFPNQTLPPHSNTDCTLDCTVCAHFVVNPLKANKNKER